MQPLKWDAAYSVSLCKNVCAKVCLVIGTMTHAFFYFSTFVAFVNRFIPYDDIALTKVIAEIPKCGDIADNRSNRARTVR